MQDLATVECVALDGTLKSIPRSELVLRPAAYALIVHEGRALLTKMRATGKYHLPGGGIEVGERVAETLIRETREETGIEIEVGELVHFAELFFYYDPSQHAYHGLHLYFVCHPRSLSVIQDDQVEDGAAGEPGWVNVQDLKPGDFQVMGEVIIALLQRGIQLGEKDE